MLVRYFSLITLLPLLILAIPARSNPSILQGIKKCLPDNKDLKFSLATQYTDRSAQKDPNPDRPIAYIQYLATHKRGAQWLGLVMITKKNTCINPSPSGEAVDYERYAPFDIAVLLQKRELLLQEKQEQAILALVKQGKGPPGDLYSPAYGDSDSGSVASDCGSLTAVEAEARKQMEWLVEGCDIQQRRLPKWEKRSRFLSD